MTTLLAVRCQLNNLSPVHIQSWKYSIKNRWHRLGKFSTFIAPALQSVWLKIASVVVFFISFASLFYMILTLYRNIHHLLPIKLLGKEKMQLSPNVSTLSNKVLITCHCRVEKTARWALSRAKWGAWKWNTETEYHHHLHKKPCFCSSHGWSNNAAKCCLKYPPAHSSDSPIPDGEFVMIIIAHILHLSL